MTTTRRVRRVTPTQQPSTGSRMGGSMPAAFMGIDPSLRGTGLAVVDETGKPLWSHGWTEKKTLQARFPEKLSWYKMPDRGDNDANRMRRVFLVSTYIAMQIKWWRKYYNLSVALEGYAFSQLSMRASDLHELGGAIKMAVCEEVDLPLRVYDPLSLKLAWTGSGTADKSLMIMTCFKLFDEDYTPLETAGENLADAMLLAQLLRTEAMVKSGAVALDSLSEPMRRVMLRTTKSMPESLVSRPFIAYSDTCAVEPVFGSGANAWWLTTV